MLPNDINELFQTLSQKTLPPEHWPRLSQWLELEFSQKKSSFWSELTSPQRLGLLWWLKHAPINACSTQWMSLGLLEPTPSASPLELMLCLDSYDRLFLAKAMRDGRRVEPDLAISLLAPLLRSRHIDEQLWAIQWMENHPSITRNRNLVQTMPLLSIFSKQWRQLRRRFLSLGDKRR